MKINLKTLIICLVLATPLNRNIAEAQMLQDTSAVNLIRKCIGNIYNFKFDKASELYSRLNHSYPDHPALYVLKALETYWENWPLLPTSQASSSFEKDLRYSIQLCEKKQGTEYEAEYLLTNLCARGFLLLFYSDNDLNVDVFPLATSSYQYIRRSFNFTSYNSDLYFFTGMYNYYREAYPEAYPVYEALAILFPKGNKLKGLSDLSIAAENSIFLKAESYSFLSLIYLSFENNFFQAYKYSKSLHELYPDNLGYLADYLKNLLLIKKYDEAETIMRTSLIGAKNTYYQVLLTIFNGILQEKKYHDYKKAEQFYDKGARDISLFGDYGNDFAAICYFGLSRISEIKGDKQYKKIYRKLALKLTDFKKVNFDE